MSSEPVRVANTSGDSVAKVQIGAESGRISLDLIAGVQVALDARLGESRMTVETLMGLKAGAIVTLETGLADHVDLYLNSILIARGEIVAVAGKYGVRIVELPSRS
ncbi:MAG TPA: FliM/FliN family flagellar motor switch protein [Rhizomicrobium sp.]|nr:FliM/FliN family flagellar motor switch protein [Rhizomicrobium sp.]